MNEGPACGSGPRCVLGFVLSSSMVISLVMSFCVELTFLEAFANISLMSGCLIA